MIIGPDLPGRKKQNLFLPKNADELVNKKLGRFGVFYNNHRRAITNPMSVGDHK
jgi:hypothetical protein